MKKKSDWLMAVLLLIFCCIIFGFFYKSVTRKPDTVYVNFKTDSVEILNFEKSYLTQLINMGYWENGETHKIDTIKVYEMKDEKMQISRYFGDLLRKNSRNLFIRYTEIGCNSCADSTFKYLNQYEEVKSLYNIIVLVDFSNYDSYLKWMKISEINYPVYWLKKGNLPFKIETDKSSYLFSVNTLSKVDNFFVPDSKFPEYINNYFSFLDRKL